MEGQYPQNKKLSAALFLRDCRKSMKARSVDSLLRDLRSHEVDLARKAIQSDEGLALRHEIAEIIITRMRRQRYLLTALLGVQLMLIGWKLCEIINH